MTINLDTLRKTAEAATPGPWEASDRGIGYEVHDASGYELNSGMRETFTESDATHIATFDPPTVLELIDRAEAAERALDFHSQRDRELKMTLSMISDRLDEHSYDELSSLIEDEPLDQWGETYKSRLEKAEQALDATERQVVARSGETAAERIWRGRAEQAEQAVARVREAVKDAPTSDPTQGFAGPPDDYPDIEHFIGNGEWTVAERVRRALDGDGRG